MGAGEARLLNGFVLFERSGVIIELFLEQYVGTQRVIKFGVDRKECVVALRLKAFGEEEASVEVRRGVESMNMTVKRCGGEIAAFETCTQYM